MEEEEEKEKEKEEQEDLRRRQPKRRCQEDGVLPHDNAVPNLHTSCGKRPHRILASHREGTQW